mmetsp:Transcript_37253/g.98157  ORF Transcript_37253/g.98157 Transcript_37253/m.98157 type:complete len:207 (-) Transcript_37253:292-912(-)
MRRNRRGGSAACPSWVRPTPWPSSWGCLSRRRSRPSAWSCSATPRAGSGGRINPLGRLPFRTPSSPSPTSEVGGGSSQHRASPASTRSSAWLRSSLPTATGTTATTTAPRRSSTPPAARGSSAGASLPRGATARWSRWTSARPCSGRSTTSPPVSLTRSTAVACASFARTSRACPSRRVPSAGCMQGPRSIVGHRPRMLLRRWLGF